MKQRVDSLSKDVSDLEERESVIFPKRVRWETQEYWRQSSRTRRRNKSNKTRTTNYLDNKSFIDDSSRYKIGQLAELHLAK